MVVRLRSSRAGRAALLGLAALGMGALAFRVFILPAMANDFGYALTGADGLPDRIRHGDRIYVSSGTCAGPFWCRGDQPECRSGEDLIRGGRWPLTRVGSIPTVFGTPRPILRGPEPGPLAFGLYIPRGDGCYQAYGLSGGP